MEIKEFVLNHFRIYKMIHPPFWDLGLGFWYQNQGNGNIHVLNIHFAIWCLEISWLINNKGELYV
jgi:hypothetical protein